MVQGLPFYFKINNYIADFVQGDFMKKNTFTSPGIESQSIEALSKQLLETTAQLYAANEQLQREQEQKREMLANISHDLRAPITAIRSSIDYLTSGLTLSNEELDSSLQLIHRRTMTLENLIQDMYFLFCVEDTSRALEFEIVEAAPFFETYFYDAICDTKFDEKNMTLDLPETLSCTFSIDVQKIIRVLDNLFNNAAKYSPEGADITLRIEHDADSGYLSVSVIDTGYGIPEHAVEHVFGRTYTVSSARTPNSVTGSGLGLAIVKAIVERHGGTVSCESTEGKGSRFSFTLPVQ